MIRRLWPRRSADRREQTEATDPAPGVAEPGNDAGVQRARGLITQELAAAEDAFTTCWEDHADLAGSIDALKTWYGWRTALAGLEQVDGPELSFHIDGYVLRDCYEMVCAEPDVETFTYLTGLAVGPSVRTVNRCLPVAHAEQSATGAVPDPDASFTTVFELERQGRQLVAYGHNHPGAGAAAADPSATDRRYQRLLEADYDVIGLIFTRDGYVRCFSNDLAYTVTIHGNHVQQEEPELFRLETTARTRGGTADT